MKTFAIALSATLLATACAEEGDELLGGAPGPTGNGTAAPEPPKPPPTCADLQTTYAGFAGTKLEAGRTDYALGQERTRNKPFEALKDDYKRLFGAEPASLTSSAPTFGEAPPRWFVEPVPGAVSLYQSYRVAFEACLGETKTDPQWAVAPTTEAAKTQCAAWQRKFWSRTPPSESIAACATVAVTDSASEVVPGGATRATDPRRRWAYACASVLTAGDFVMY